MSPSESAYTGTFDGWAHSHLLLRGEREMERENKHKATHVWSLIIPGAGANCLPSFTPSPTNTLTNNITAPHSNLYVCTRSCLTLTSDPLNVGEEEVYRGWTLKRTWNALQQVQMLRSQFTCPQHWGVTNHISKLFWTLCILSYIQCTLCDAHKIFDSLILTVYS